MLIKKLLLLLSLHERYRHLEQVFRLHLALSVLANLLRHSKLHPPRLRSPVRRQDLVLAVGHKIPHHSIALQRPGRWPSACSIMMHPNKRYEDRRKVQFQRRSDECIRESCRHRFEQRIIEEDKLVKNFQNLVDPCFVLDEWRQDRFPGTRLTKLDDRIQTLSTQKFYIDVEDKDDLGIDCHDENDNNVRRPNPIVNLS